MKPEAATVADLAAIKALLGVCALPHDDVTEALIPDFLVLRARGRVAGCAGFERHGSDALLRSVALGAPLRGKGHGARLVDAIETRARTQDILSFYLLTTTAADFFTHLGYHPIDRRTAPPRILASPEFTTLCPSSAVCMVKDLRA